MKDFDYDVKQKKDVARSVKNRVGKRKGCSLPSDGLTDAQWRRRNSEIQSVNLNKPISYEQFKLLHRDLQEEYIQKIIDTYEIGITVISTVLFGLGRSSLAMYMRSHGLKCSGRKGPAKADKLERFVRFCNSEPEEPQAETEETVELPETAGDAVKALEDHVWITEQAPKADGVVASWSFVFESVDDLSQIVKLISNLPIPQHARVSISCIGPEDRT